MIQSTPVFRLVAVLVALLASTAASPVSAQRDDDPFRRTVTKANVKVPQKPSGEVAPPALAARKADCLKTVAEPQAIDSSPCVYLVRELTVTGVFEGPNGLEALVQAKPTHATFFLRPGDRLYDGEVLSIHALDAVGPAGVIVNETRREYSGKKVRAVTNPVKLEVSAPQAGKK